MLILGRIFGTFIKLFTLYLDFSNIGHLIKNPQNLDISRLKGYFFAYFLIEKKNRQNPTFQIKI